MEQNLHHFVNGSTWDWSPLRRALARGVAAEVGDTFAWVGLPLVIPKAGNKSVGVQRRFHPQFGRTLSGQWALGLWIATESACAPVNWHIEIPPLGGRDRTVGAIRADRVMAEWTGSIVDSLLMEIEPPRSPRLLVIDGRGLDAAGLSMVLRHTSIPLVIRIAEDCPVEVVSGPRPSTAGRVVEYSRCGLHTESRKSTIYSKSAVRLPGRPTVAGDLTLWGLDHTVRGRSGTLWLSNSEPIHVGGVVRARRLLELVEATQEQDLDQLGIRDFAGRSFDGWHRHATLVSIAHMIRSFGKPAALQRRSLLPEWDAAAGE